MNILVALCDFDTFIAQFLFFIFIFFHISDFLVWLFLFQKYRLHARRPSPAIQSSGSSNTQPPQFLVVGGIWVPPPDSGTVVQPPAGPTTNGVYALVPTLPQISPIPLHQVEKRAWTGPLQWDGRGSLEEGHVDCSSPTTSSSSHTTTTSPVF